MHEDMTDASICTFVRIIKTEGTHFYDGENVRDLTRPQARPDKYTLFERNYYYHIN
jgi:hypothetical protein